MLGKQAKPLSPGALRRLLSATRRSRTPERNRVIILLSVRAGLRACEIARLTWGMVLDAEGNVGRVLDVRAGIAKRRSGRRIPMHPQLAQALKSLKATTDFAPLKADAPVVRSARGTALRANSIVNWFVAECVALGLEGCSSHSGRRTFITKAARAAHRAGASLRDVQALAGHRSIETTQRYIDGDTDAQRRLVSLLYGNKP
jgi:integrase/recombinase XerD